MKNDESQPDDLDREVQAFLESRLGRPLPKHLVINPIHLPLDLARRLALAAERDKVAELRAMLIEVANDHHERVQHGYESSEMERRCPVCDGEMGSGSLGIIHDGACRLDDLLERTKP